MEKVHAEGMQLIFIRPNFVSNQCRLERWSIFHDDGMAMAAFLQRWNGDGFENFSPSSLMVFGGINHWQQWFFNGFFQFWGPMVLDGYKLKFATKSLCN